uniref:Uncharacterized protein n=1 Tax=Lepeophtheirus salmonis TaxID=72036 RepID=A0A0K2TUN9_LEPSM
MRNSLSPTRIYTYKSQGVKPQCYSLSLMSTRSSCYLIFFFYFLSLSN